MLQRDLKNLNLIPFNDIFRQPEIVSERSGVYMFFLQGGLRILESTSYFDMDARRPFSVNGFHHLYTGAAGNLRQRMKQHSHRDVRSSSLRKTLLAVELMRAAVSGKGAPKIDSEERLSDWLRANAVVGIQFAARPFEREQALIDRYISPFNITHRRRHPYSKALMKWRNEVFPPWRPLPTAVSPRLPTC